jgi:murein peptide amidase A
MSFAYSRDNIFLSLLPAILMILIAGGLAATTSVLGYPIDLYEFGENTEHKVLIIGGIHGNEKEGVEFADSLGSMLKNIPPDSLKIKFYIVPLLNPDGYALSLRQNANLIDLNRNFPTGDFAAGDKRSRYYGGETPASEPETRYVMALMDSLRPVILIMLHTPYKCVNYDGAQPEKAQALARKLGISFRDEIGYATPGSIGTYYGRERGIDVITLELPAVNDVWERYGTGFWQWLTGTNP